MNIQVGSMIKLNPSMFGNEPSNEEVYGTLGYVGILRLVNFQVVSINMSDVRGASALCKLINPNTFVGVDGIKEVVCEGELIILLADMVPAICKVTIDYEIIKGKQLLVTDEIKRLKKFREKKKQEGFTSNNAIMKDNWQQLKVLRAESSETIPEEFTQIRLPKHKSIGLVKIESKLIPNESSTEEEVLEFKMRLAGIVSSFRKKPRVDTTTKFYHGQAIEKLNGVSVKAGQYAEAYEGSLIDILNEDKIPTDTLDNYIGIEVEFIHLRGEDVLKKLFIKERLHKNVQLTSDPSVKPCHNQNGYQGSELRILVKAGELSSVMEKLERVFNNPKVDAYANRSCGLHVHLDSRGRDVSLMYKNLFRVQSLLIGSQPVARTQGTFCKKNEYDEFDAEQEPMRPGWEKYLVINPIPHKRGRNTLEVRVHEGTTDTNAIRDWAMFLNTIVSHTQELPKQDYKKSSELLEFLKLPASSVKYVDNRISKFNHAE